MKIDCFDCPKWCDMSNKISKIRQRLIKSLSPDDDLPTVIFDDIHTGIWIDENICIMLLWVDEDSRPVFVKDGIAYKEDSDTDNYVPFAQKPELFEGYSVSFPAKGDFRIEIGYDINFDEVVSAAVTAWHVIQEWDTND